MNYVPLHVYDGYSFLKSGMTTANYVSYCKKQGFNELGIANLGVCHSFPSFERFCLDNSIHPVFGLDVYIEGNLLTLFIKNEEGYKNICFLSSKLKDNSLEYDDLLDNGDGLIGVFPTSNPKLYDYFLHNQKELPKFLVRFSKLVDDFYLGLEFYDDSQKGYIDFIRSFASDFSYEIVMFPHIKYIKKEDEITLQIVNAIKNASQLVAQEATGPNYILTDEETCSRYSEKERENTYNISHKCLVKIDEKRGKILRYNALNEDDCYELLKEKAFSGLKEKIPDYTSIYEDRLNYELSIIKKLGFSSYFLLVQDYVLYAKNNDILVGPGRGSSAGSLVAFSLSITEPDPIKYNLVFERFLNESRKTMPDIDVDFQDIKREAVISYLEEKYSKDRVAQIVTFQTIKAKESLRDIGRVFPSFPARDIDMLAKLIGDKYTSLREAYKYVPSFKARIDSDKYYLTIVTLAVKLEGLPRQSGLHAAGVVLNDEKLDLDLPIFVNNEGKTVTQYSMEYLEKQGFLKMDILSLSNLTSIETCVNLVKQNKGVEIDPYNIPLDDPKAYEIINKGSVIGLFQLDGTGKRAVSILKPTSFMEICDLIALIRPGNDPKNIPLFKDVKDGKIAPSYPSESIKEILEPTYGFIIYQEQIMQIARVYAGFSLSEADDFRRAISKKKSEMFAKLKDKFIQGAKDLNHDTKEAEKVYSMLEKFANYGFVKAHSVGYAMISVREAYLKAYYPSEFYTAILGQTSISNDAKFDAVISEMRKENIHISLPDINKSVSNFKIENNKMYFPLSAIKGFPNNFVECILEEREKGDFKSFKDFISRMYQYKLSESLLLKLINSGCFDSFKVNRETLRNNVGKALKYGELVSKVIYQPLIGESFIPEFSLTDYQENKINDLDMEYETLGMMLSGSPLEFKKEALKGINITHISELDNVTSTCTLCVIIKAKKEIKTKKGTPMGFVTIFDDTGEAEIVVFPEVYAASSALLIKNQIVLISGYINRNSDKAFIASSIKELEDHE